MLVKAEFTAAGAKWIYLLVEEVLLFNRLAVFVDRGNHFFTIYGKCICPLLLLLTELFERWSLNNFCSLNGDIY